MHRKLARGLREGGLLLAVAVAVYLLMALASFSPLDPSWSSAGAGGRVHNLGGVAGSWIADALLSAFGVVAYAVPVLALVGGWRLYRWGQQAEGARPLNVSLRTAGLIVLLLSACGLAAGSGPARAAALPQGSGGVLGALVGHGVAHAFGPVGSTLVLLTLLVVSLPIVLSFSWLAVMDAVGGMVLAGAHKLWAHGRGLVERRRAARAFQVVRPPEPKAATRSNRERRAAKPRRAEQLSLPMQDQGEVAQKVPKPKRGDGPSLPPLELLDGPRASGQAYSAQELERMSADLERHLSDFGVQVKVVAAQPGPVITRFEVQPAPGVKVSQISNLSKDLARALSVLSVRVVEIIPGKSVMGLEIPNDQREVVALSEIIQASQYANAGSALTLALGKDIGGTPVTADLSRMPHLLVAGTTGSGKSVAVNAMILSMVYKAPAESVRFIMIDPKMLELSVYEGIPHLLAPVVTDMKEAANALRWCVAEMERRYRLMAALGVRNLSGYNRKVGEAQSRGEPIPDPFAEADGADSEGAPPGLERLPHIVVIVDELADMMMVVGKKVEELIARLAQKARAAGIHLILATQRPSVDVITGLIKANIPTRISFQVSSRVDSRTILDQSGAESLLGYGDMLYLPPGTAMPQRVHGAFVDDHEVHKVVAYLKQLGEPDYMEDILSGESETTSAVGDDDAESDPLYDQAVNVVIESRKASISYVQRRLRVGYNRAARLVEQMERSGLVGPLQSNGSREVLVPPSE